MYGVSNVDFDRQTYREDNIFLFNPIPHDKRFEPINADINQLSHHKNSYFPRIDDTLPKINFIEGSYNSGADYNPKKDLVLKKLNIGAIEFKKHSTRKANTNLKPYPIPGYYDHESLERGHMTTKDYKNPKGAVSMEKQSKRGNAIYNFEKETLRIIKKHT